MRLVDAANGTLVLNSDGSFVYTPDAGFSVLVVHLGMSGRLTLEPATTAVRPHEHLAFGLQQELALPQAARSLTDEEGR